MLVKSAPIRFAFATILAVISGCQPTGQFAVQPVAPAQPLPLADSSESSAQSSLSALAEQSQRDVDLLLKSRDALAKSVIASPSEARPPRTVVWNDPKPPERPPAATETQSNTAAKPAPEATNIVAPPPSTTPVLGPDRLKALMVDLSRELYATGSYSDAPLRELLMIAAMSMIDPQRQLDPQAIPDLNEKERELLSKLQLFFAELGQSVSGQNDAERAIIDAVAKLREGLVKPPSLRLPTTALCTRVGGFADYSVFDKYSFLAQSQQKFIVYLEIADFTSELNPKGEYVTQIAQQLTIYSDRDGIPVWKEDWQTAVDVTKTKRQDFFTVQVVTLPKALTVGKYQLKVRARDEKSAAEAEASIPFEIVADARLAATVGK